MKPETPFFDENGPRFVQKGLPRGWKGKKEEKEASVKPETPFFEENGPRFVQKGLPRGWKCEAILYPQVGDKTPPVGVLRTPKVGVKAPQSRR